MNLDYSRWIKKGAGEMRKKKNKPTKKESTFLFQVITGCAIYHSNSG